MSTDQQTQSGALQSDVGLPQRNPPFGQPNPDAFGHRCNFCRRKATQWKWLNKRENFWVWVCKAHLTPKLRRGGPTHDDMKPDEQNQTEGLKPLPAARGSGADGARVYHKAAKLNRHGQASALCYPIPRPIPESERWTIRDEAVTCWKCLKILAASETAKVIKEVLAGSRLEGNAVILADGTRVGEPPPND